MPRFDEEYPNTTMNRQRDLVLSSNELCFLQSKTNGVIKTYTGPITMTISAQEALVRFNPKTKMFEETQDFESAKQLFTSAPEGWYVVLKNPAVDGSHPEIAKGVSSPELVIGHKVNIPGPVSFSLFPGQMTKVVRGHRLRSNQYLLARVYDAEAAKTSGAVTIDAEGNDVQVSEQDYFVGQMIVIKGTEISFYIPPTGIEVIPSEETGEYVRDAVTLERLEYAILKDEDGEKRYIHGPAVVFPKPTETFVTSPKNTLIFRALELSPISGIYVKVIAAYDEKKDGKTLHHPIGEELFITGNDQMIYYPRPEHALIQYDGKYMHHAIAIPEGEGRYVLNRLTGAIATIKGPRMYLPDPRTEVIVKRKLTAKECNLLYPHNEEVLDYNISLSEQALERRVRKGLTNNPSDIINCAYSTSDQESTLAIFEANASISRGVSYTKPRTITLDTKYDGVVSVDVWGGFAVNVVSKSGKRDVVIGPTTVLLDYDQTIEPINLSSGCPKTEDCLIQTAFLKIDNNRVSDCIAARTADGVSIEISLFYFVNFLREYSNKWFAIDNYIKYLSDYLRSLVKGEVKKYNVKEFYANYNDIVKNIVLDVSDGNTRGGRLFETNGMLITDVDVFNITMDANIAKMFKDYEQTLIQQSIDLSAAKQSLDLTTELEQKKREIATIENETTMHAIALKKAKDEATLAAKAIYEIRSKEIDKAREQANADLQMLITANAQAELDRRTAERDAEVIYKQQLAEVETDKQKTYANTVEQIVKAISPDLIAAIASGSHAELLRSGMENMAPWAIANGESVPDVVNKLLRGTPLENLLTNFNLSDNN